MLSLDELFDTDGPLGRVLPDFRRRESQVRMASRVAAALESREQLVVEAGTGTGKTFAYLVPALLCGGRVIISTGTRTLQDQLFAKDLPLVAAALGRPAKVTLLKGRGNYLCRHRLSLALGQLSLPVGETRREPWLARIERWSRTTRTGDLAEIPGLSDTHPSWVEMTSTRDNCLGSRCEEFSRCHLVAARRAAQECDIVIVNHHLLLADLALKEEGFGDILGSADAVILDEAHQLPDLATMFFGADLSSRRLEQLLDTLAQSRSAAGAVPSASAIEPVRALLQTLRGHLPARAGRHAWRDCAGALTGTTLELAEALETLADELERADEEDTGAPGAAALREAAAQARQIASVEEVQGARSAECLTRGFALHLLPFDIAERFRAHVHGRSCAWIFTSATLSVGEDFRHFTTRLGLEEASTLRIESPFDYGRQSLLYLPRELPEPAAPDYLERMLAAMLPLIEASAGGVFVLFTSHRALAEGAARLRQCWSPVAPYPLYVQGDAPREHLLQSFRRDGNAVLLGTASFWEGVDVKGSALRLVIIEKLPFASPEDPLVRARIEHLETCGANAFREFQLPEAALALKQGVGRLIRSETDHGAVVICDRRLSERA
ncbi:MAG TPA: ATP-dependent DNA helicase, partial [Steroidobacteraceae bacterium]|nr:ATP-dependent DNA helicase [Steroidobacteraceae bacterium]